MATHPSDINSSHNVITFGHTDYVMDDEIHNDVTQATTGILPINATTLIPKKTRVDPHVVDQSLWIYVSPITFFVGVVGNILVLLVMIKFRKQAGNDVSNAARALSIYFGVMAVADIGFILFGIVPEWLEVMVIVDFGEIHPIACKVEKFVFYTSGDIAIWIICVFSLDRFYAVCFTLKRHSGRWLQKVLKHPIGVSCAVSVLAALKNFHVFWTRGLVKDGSFRTNCGRPEPYAYFEEFIRPWLAFVLVSFIPTVIIIICNVSITVTLVRASKLRRASSSSDKSFMQTISMCMSASIAFLLCITPSMIIYIGRAYWTNPDKPENNPYSYDIAKAVSNQMSYINHSINFFLYCLTGQKFRETLRTLFCPRHFIKQKSYMEHSRNGNHKSKNKSLSKDSASEVERSISNNAEMPILSFTATHGTLKDIVDNAIASTKDSKDPVLLSVSKLAQFPDDPV